jgi:uncharacterized zinc-type alcohol dehydrogenase-like protein
MCKENDLIRENSRRDFIKNSVVAGAGLMLANNAVFAFVAPFAANIQGQPIKTRGYAATDKSGRLTPWTFERRSVGDDDILIDIKFSGVCHSDIHTVRGEWGDQRYPLVPGHEIAGVVTAIGKNVTKFKIGDQAGVGCMVDSCGTCASCKKGEEQYCDNKATVMTYGTPDKTSPSGITQGGYSTNIVVKSNFAILIPKEMPLREAAPLLCAGVTTYSPLMKAKITNGMKVGVAGIGGLGHVAIKLAVSKGAKVYAFTTSADKAADIKGFGAKEVIVVDDINKLKAYAGILDYMISTSPQDYDLGAYSSMVKPDGYYTQVGLPAGKISFNNFAFVNNRVNFNGSLIGGIAETQEVLDYCAAHKVYPVVQTVKAQDLNQVYEKVVNKQARYRYVIDTASI